MQHMGFIDLKSLSRWYGTHRALNDVSLHLEPGRIGLLGPNGAGKSTLLKILLGLLPPSSGEGTILGHRLGREGRSFSTNGDSSTSTAADLRRAIGYMPEADALIPGLKGAEYVALAGELYGMPRKEAARRAHEVLTYLELEDARYRKLEEYSTGMKQRLKLAQAVVHDPPVLLLDEPTSGLDPAGREAMLSLLLALGRDHGKSLILSTHLLGDVERVCEQVVILHLGRVRGQGGVRELCARRQDRYRLQVEGDRTAFAEELRLEGAQVLHDNGRGELRVAVPPGWATRAFFVLAEQHDVTVRQVLRGDEPMPVFNASGNAAAMFKPADILKLLGRTLNLNGTGITFRNFIWWEGYLVMIVLALAGSVLVGNDFHHGSLAFYLAKPLTRWHYVLGKGLAIAVFVNLMTTLPALLLWAQYGLLDGWGYFLNSAGLVLGILGYGAVLTVVLA